MGRPITRSIPIQASFKQSNAKNKYKLGNAPTGPPPPPSLVETCHRTMKSKRFFLESPRVVIFGPSSQMRLRGHTSTTQQNAKTFRRRQRVDELRSDVLTRAARGRSSLTAAAGGSRTPQTTSQWSLCFFSPKQSCLLTYGTTKISAKALGVTWTTSTSR